MSSNNLNPNPEANELWFAKFFIGSMISITFLTIVLSFLPSPSGLRNSPPIKTQALTLSVAT